MLDWLTQRLPRTRRARAAQREAALKALIADHKRQEAAREAEYQAWLAGLPASTQTLLREKPRDQQKEARQWAALTPPSDSAHAIARHVRWTDAPPAYLPGTSLATRIALLMVFSPPADEPFYRPDDLAVAFDGDFNAKELTAVLTGRQATIAVDTLIKIERFYQTDPQYLVPGMFICVRGGVRLCFGSQRVWAEGMQRRLLGEAYTDPLWQLPIGQQVAAPSGDHDAA